MGDVCRLEVALDQVEILQETVNDQKEEIQRLMERIFDDNEIKSG